MHLYDDNAYSFVEKNVTVLVSRFDLANMNYFIPNSLHGLSNQTQDLAVRIMKNYGLQRVTDNLMNLMKLN